MADKSGEDAVGPGLEQAGQDLMEGTQNLLEQMQQWGFVTLRAQQLLGEFAAEQLADGRLAEQSETMMRRWMEGADAPARYRLSAQDPMDVMRRQSEMITSSFEYWGKLMTSGLDGWNQPVETRDKRFRHEGWDNHPVFAAIAQAYQFTVERMLAWADDIDGLNPDMKAKLRFNLSNALDAVSPTNFAMTNPQVLERAYETRGESLLKGLEHMLSDLRKGQLTHTDPNAFELGENIATTPGKVVHETPLYQLIHYAPTTDKVLKTPLVVFPPWINRFYILDLNEKKSFVKWVVDQGVSLFMVSWKSADASMADVEWDDYVAAQIDAIDTIRDALGVEQVHTIGYCVAGTTLAATLALLAERDEADKVASATFFTAQVDFEEAGDLLLFTGDEHMQLVEQLSEPGYLDGRYMAATFNMLRGRDLIWNYVVTNYLLGEDYPAFDLLHWNGDTTNLPRKWHRSYLDDLYRENKLVKPGAIRIDGTPIDLGKIETPAYIQAGKEDHIAPLASVWKLMDHLSGEKRFVLAGSGHIAGVVNPPAAEKYQHWTNEDAGVETLDEFIAGASETKGSWWPDWIKWLRDQAPEEVPAKGGRKPGKGKLKAIEDAPGRYVKSR
ncbi:PHA/PHB synthase family protein [Novosphingopyxis iocasae]|uniref:PHA/PHB synthase family protein n=1 Tax=Novosphingopyxis iocasae TaxID=2762729 RepID=UPI0016512233|nr:class I poly(R)-hydroxyalkanoic acid synthase [Novosphingopyxis iocasae]